MSSICDSEADDRNKFISLTQSLLSLAKTAGDDSILIESFFKDVNKLDYRNLAIAHNDVVVLLIRRLIELIRPTDTLLIKQMCYFLRNLICNNVNLSTSFEHCTCWLLSILQCVADSLKNDILLTLLDFLRLGEYNMKKVVQTTFGDESCLIDYLTPTCMLWSEETLTVMRSLLVLLEKGGNNNDIPTTLLSGRIRNVINMLSLQSMQSYPKPQLFDKVFQIGLCILRTIVEQKYITKTVDLLGEMLGVVRAFLLYRIEGYSQMELKTLHPCLTHVPEPTHVIPTCKNLKNHRIRSKKHATNNKPNSDVKNNLSLEHKVSHKQSSDSDTSDNEIQSSVHSNSTVRLESVHLLKSLIDNSQSTDLFGYWPWFVASGIENMLGVLTESILKEPVSKLRRSMLCALTELLIGAKPFLTGALEYDERTASTSNVCTVGFMINELHFTLSVVIERERNIAVLTQALKCAAALIHATPYAKLSTGLISNFVNKCRPHILHKDPTVRVATLSVFEILASSDPITPEIYYVLAKPSNNMDNSLESLRRGIESPLFSEIIDHETEEEIDIEDLLNRDTNDCYKDNVSKKERISSIVYICLKNIRNESMVPVRIQSLKLVGRMAFTTGQLIFSHVDIVASTLSSVLKDPEPQVVLHATRTLEIMAGCLSKEWYSDINVFNFWNICFDKVVALRSVPQTVLREAACDCLGSIGSTMKLELPRVLTVTFLTTLFDAFRDEESAVRAAAVRALGMQLTHDGGFLQKETGFLMDVANTVCVACSDQNLGVRVKGAWTMANLCDCLLKLETRLPREPLEDSEPVPLDIVLPKLYDVSVKATKDNDKVKCNAVRALGIILELCPNRETLQNTSLALDALIRCATSGSDMKVRWNACRALGLALSCNNSKSIFPATWKDQVLPALSTLIYQSPNFKVRTLAAWALSQPTDHGNYTATIWKSIALAFENAQHVPTSTEYAHHDALTEQLCLTLINVAICMKESDLQPVWTECGKHHIEYFVEKIKDFRKTDAGLRAINFILAQGRMMRLVEVAKSFKDRQIARKLVNIFEGSGCLKEHDSIEYLY